jgi:hypothetical protein
MSNLTNTVAAISPEALAWCGNYASFALTLAEAFLILAFLVALIETGCALWAKLQAARGVPAVVPRAVAAAVPEVDPVKLLEALKGVLEALKGLPAWVAIFLAGLALLWMAGQKLEICAQTNTSRSSDQATANQTGPHASNLARATGQASNGQAQTETNATH